MNGSPKSKRSSCTTTKSRKPARRKKPHSEPETQVGMKAKLKARATKAWVPILILILCAISSIFAKISSEVKWLKILDLKILDTTMKIKGGIKAHKDIILVKIDSSTMDKMKQAYGPEWRKYHPKIIEALQGAKIIAFDFFFRGPTEHDKELFQEMARSDNIVIGIHPKTPANILCSAKPGHIEFHTDIDGLIRRVQPIKIGLRPTEDEKGTTIARHYYEPSFMFRILHMSSNVKYYESDCGTKIYGVEVEGDKIRIHLGKIITDNEGMMHIRHLAQNQEFTEISYYDVYTDNFTRAKVNEKLVIIGLKTPPDDIHRTPYGEKHGLMLNALALNTVLTDAYITHFSGYRYTAFLFISSIILLVSSIHYATTIRIPIILALIIMTIVASYFSYWTQTVPQLINLSIAYVLVRWFQKKVPELAQPKKAPTNWFVLFILIFLTCSFGIALRSGEKHTITAFFVSLLAAGAFYLLEFYLKPKRQEKREE